MTKRLQDIELKIMALEHTIDALNTALIKQDKILLAMQKQLVVLAEKQAHHNEQQAVAPFDLINDRPPHY